MNKITLIIALAIILFTYSFNSKYFQNIKIENSNCNYGQRSAISKDSLVQVHVSCISKQVRSENSHQILKILRFIIFIIIHRSFESSLECLPCHREDSS